MKYLHSVDRARVLRRSGSVLTLNMMALRKEMEKRNDSQRPPPKVAAECSNCGVAHSSRLPRGGNRKSGRQRQRLKREILRDQRIVSQVLTRSLNPPQGGSVRGTWRPLGGCKFYSKWGIPVKKVGIQIQQEKSILYMWEAPHMTPID